MSLNCDFRNPNLPVPLAQAVAWPEFESYSDVCRQSINLGVESLQLIAQEVTSRSWDFWTEYYNLLGDYEASLIEFNSFSRSIYC